MLEARATVIHSNEGMAVVETQRASGCGHCDGPNGCGKSRVAKLFCAKPSYFEVIDPIGSKAGDEVWIAVAEGALLNSSAVVYLIPLFLLFLGAVAGSFFGGELVSVVGAMTGLLVGFFFARKFSAKNLENHQFRPYILSRIN